MKLRKTIQVVIGILIISIILIDYGKVRLINQKITESEEKILNPTHILDIDSINIPEGSYGYYYNQLNTIEKKLYIWFISDPQRFREFVAVKKINRDNVINVISAVDLDSHYYYISEYYLRDEEENLLLKLQWEDLLTDKQINKIENEAEKILKKLNGKSKEEDIIQIYNWCNNNLEYKEEINCKNLFGAFVNKQVVCVGYARAFSYLCNAVGITTICVDNDRHMWNYIYFNEKWYAVDVGGGEAGTPKNLLKGKEFLSDDIHVPEESKFVIPDLAERSFYPFQDDAIEILDYLDTNIDVCEKQMKEIEKGWKSGDNDYEDIYKLFDQTKELAIDIYNHIQGTTYYWYLNTEEYESKNKTLQELINQLNNYDW